MRAPLDGIRVVEFGQLVAAPSAALQLQDLGASVVKVESPSGEAARKMPTPTAGSHPVGSTYIAYNRGKRSIALDLKHSQGQAIAARLVAGADVVIENFRDGALETYGLSAAQMRGRNRRLIYASIRGYGPETSAAGQRMVDNIAQATSGIMAVTGEETVGPMRVGFTLVDAAAAILTAQAVCAALFARERTGEGAAILVPLLDAALHLQAAPITEYLATREVPERTGTASALAAPSQAFRVRDGHVMLVAYLERDFRALTDVLGRRDLLDDPRYATSATRLAHRHELAAELERELVRRDADDWLADLDRAGIMASKIMGYDDVVGLEAAQQMLIDEDARGAIGVNSPVRHSYGRASLEPHAPALGQHSIEILLELGFSIDEADALRRDGVVHGPTRNAEVERSAV